MRFITQLIFISHSLNLSYVHRTFESNWNLWRMKKFFACIDCHTTTCIIFNVNLTHIASHWFNLIAFNNRAIFTAYGITRIEKKGKINGWKNWICIWNEWKPQKNCIIWANAIDAIRACSCSLKYYNKKIYVQGKFIISSSYVWWQKKETKGRNSFELIRVQEEENSTFCWYEFAHLYWAPDCCWK